MIHRADRRTFLRLSSATGAGLLAAGCAGLGAKRHVTGKLRHASIGVGGMGKSDLEQLSGHGDVEIVALCDVDQGHLDAAAELHPGARTYRDWRELLEAEADSIDSVNVTTPDHMHAAITLAAMRAGKHVYCQKPLTRTVAEARAVGRATRSARVVTQMGIQNHSNTPYARALALFQAGHVGRIHRVHVWSDRPAGWWPQAVDRPAKTDPVPETLDWDKWLGVAPERPYVAETYHPFVWRGWKDFGTGAQGDMGCHLMDPALWFLGLGHPLSIRSDGPAPNDETYPAWSRVRYEFPPNELTAHGPLPVTWYDGGKKVWRELLDEYEAGEVWANGCLFEGENGALLVSPYQDPRLLPESRFADVAMPEIEGVNHWHQYVDACFGRCETSAPFEYAAFMTEVALLGNVALHFPHDALEWNGDRGRFDRGDANELLHTPYRRGWSVRNLG